MYLYEIILSNKKQEISGNFEMISKAPKKNGKVFVFTVYYISTLEIVFCVFLIQHNTLCILDILA